MYGTVSGVYNAAIDVRTNTSLTVSNLTAGTTYYFAIYAYDANANEGPLSSEIQASIPNVPIIPQITNQPVSQTVGAGATAVFTVGATNPAPMTYQWYASSAPVPGATNSTLALTNAQDANAGNYDVVIASSGGSVTSSVVALSIIDPPVISAQPASQKVAAGSGVYFTAVVVGTTQFSCQWYHNTTAIPGAQTNTLCLNSVTSTNDGNYYVQVQNAAGGARSANAELFVTNSTQSVSNTVVPPIYLQVQVVNQQLVLSWTNAAFNLQSAAQIVGPYTTISGAASPYTNPMTGPQNFFRLILPKS